MLPRLTIRTASAGELDRVVAFYHENDYAAPPGPADVVVVAEYDGSLCGVLRLCDDHGVLVLRGMRVSKSVQRRGIGTLLLQSAEALIGERECYCIPYTHLRPFYGRICFVAANPSEAPAFLRERWTQYRQERGLDVIIMRRPGWLKS